jgi:hypothetical protein
MLPWQSTKPRNAPCLHPHLRLRLPPPPAAPPTRARVPLLAPQIQTTRTQTQTHLHQQNNPTNNHPFQTCPTPRTKTLPSKPPPSRLKTRPIQSTSKRHHHYLTHFRTPGEGKLSTQQRNQRRRKRHITEKAQDKNIAQETKTNGMQIVPSSSASVSTRQSIPTPTPTSAPDLGLPLAMPMAHATKNDNKRRGFKGKVGTDLGLISGAGYRTLTTDVTSSSSPFKSSLAPRLVSPSERTDLPGNILVTNVDVEAGP